MTADQFDALAATLASNGPDAAIAALIADLEAERHYSALFYARLLAARHRLGVSPNPTEPSGELPEAAHEAYEAAIRDAVHAVGHKALADGDPAQAWQVFRMIGEPGPVKAALEAMAVTDADDSDALIDLALGQGVAPVWGYRLLLDRQGVCSGITALHGYEALFRPEVRREAVRLLVAALHAQLVERLRLEIEQREGMLPAATAVDELVAGRDWLFADDAAAVDVSHLSSAVQASAGLADLGAIAEARALCRYGRRLSPRLQPGGDPPFDDLYHDMDVCLGVLAVDDVDGGLAHFRAKLADDDAAAPAAELLVQLLLHLNRPAEALAVARDHLTHVDERGLGCPGPLELSRRLGDAASFAAVARDRGDPVHYLAGLLMR